MPGDLRGALTALANLPEREAKIAAGWIADAQSRLAADRVLDRLELVAGSLTADPARRSPVSN